LEQYRHDQLSVPYTYRQIGRSRRQTIQELNAALDYPSFRRPDIDVYFSYHELGHLIPIAVPVVKRNLPHLRKLLRNLCNEDIDIAVRYERALKGDLKVEGVSKAFISKVLVAHRPDLYFVKNSKSELALCKYGIQLPQGLSDGEKYRTTCQFLQQVCAEAEIKDLAVLDYYLYLEGSSHKGS
jgi:hypothetical protein